MQYTYNTIQEEQKELKHLIQTLKKQQKTNEQEIKDIQREAGICII